MVRRHLATFVSSLLVFPLWGFGATQATRVQATAPCGTTPLSQTAYRHVLWIVMENHSYGSIIGSRAAPYINKLARQCGLATNYHNITHPSLPNYVGATSGLSRSSLGKFSSDCAPSSTCSTSVSSIFNQAPSWRAYEESMPSACDRSASGEYAPRHNPPLYFRSLHGCSQHDVAYNHLAADLSHNRLPALSFVTPNFIDDMHDGTVKQGDTWLSEQVPRILNSVAYRTGTLVVFLTWDEGEGGRSGECARNTQDVGCHVATIVISPSTPQGKRSNRLFNHYSLLRTTEELLNLPLLRQAKVFNSMRTPFNL